jgi:site-specific recombinase XerD
MCPIVADSENLALGIVRAAAPAEAGGMETPFDHFFSDRTTSRTIESLKCEPLAAALAVYARRLHEDGYATHSGFVQLRLLGCFNRWLGRKGLSSEDMDPGTIQQYLRGRERSGKVRRGDSAALLRLLAMLQPNRSDATAPRPTAAETALAQFQEYLRTERSLTEATVINYTPVVRSFLSESCPRGAVSWRKITAGNITAFVQRQATLITSKRAPLVVTALRSFLRYLFHRGLVAADLAGCVPTIATWSLSKVPRFLPEEQIQKILDSCDTETAIGKRDYALLLLMARLGLRAGEVVALTLDDFDWESGLITVRGKGKRAAQMPLPSEVGTAIAEYLSAGRPRCSNRRVFIRAKAPLRGFANSVAICSLVDRAMERAGVESEYRGSHVFRHSLATQMLKHGASLPEIGDLLRHRRPDTTRIYAKVDVASLRSIALPWPGGGR